MNVNMNDVEALERRALDWVDTYSTAEAADAAVATEMAKVREEHSRGGLLLASEDALRAHEGKLRVKRDQEAFVAGSAIEMDEKITTQRLSDEIAAAEPLRSAAEQWGIGSEKFLIASLLDEQRLARAREELKGLTRMQVSELLKTWQDKDDVTNAHARMVETAVVTNTLDRLGLKDDPQSDAVALSRLAQQVQERRKARVPSWLYEAQERLGKIRTTRFAFTMGHLRSGRGVASRPKVA